MKYDEAKQHALGYAAGREDVSGIPTADNGHSWRDGFTLFAEAYAKAWDEYNREARFMMTNARDAYDTWQASGGQTIFSDEWRAMQQDEENRNYTDLESLFESYNSDENTETPGDHADDTLGHGQTL